MYPDPIGIMPRFENTITFSATKSTGAKSAEVGDKGRGKKGRVKVKGKKGRDIRRDYVGRDMKLGERRGREIKCGEMREAIRKGK